MNIWDGGMGRGGVRLDDVGVCKVYLRVHFWRLPPSAPVTCPGPLRVPGSCGENGRGAVHGKKWGRGL